MQPQPLVFPVRGILLCGGVATGTSTLSKRLVRILGHDWTRRSGGDAGRDEMARRKINGMEIDEFLEKTPGIDDIIDRENRLWATTRSHFVLECRQALMAAQGCNDLLLVYLECAEDERAKREMQPERRNCSYEVALAEVRRRDLYDEQRFHQRSGIWINDTSQYHLVVNTGEIDEDESIRLILIAMKHPSMTASVSG